MERVSATLSKHCSNISCGGGGGPRAPPPCPPFSPRRPQISPFSRWAAPNPPPPGRAARARVVCARAACAEGVFWLVAECCRHYQLPFDLMIGVNRGVYRQGVFQGQDLFDQRTSLIQYAEMFKAFPEVTFCISVLSSGLNQELVSYSWIFPHFVTSRPWWYSNIPAYIQLDCRARLQAVPKTKQIGYYSDAYKLEFVLPKYNMYRRILAHVLTEDFVRPGLLDEDKALDLARHVL